MAAVLCRCFPGPGDRPGCACGRLVAKPRQRDHSSGSIHWRVPGFDFGGCELPRTPRAAAHAGTECMEAADGFSLYGDCRGLRPCAWHGFIGKARARAHGQARVDTSESIRLEIG